MINVKTSGIMVLVMVLALGGSIACVEVGEPPIKKTAPPKSIWEFEVVPYLCMAAMKGGVTLKGIEASVDMSFSDIWSDLKIGGMLKIEAKKGRWGIFLDTVYRNLKDNIQGKMMYDASRGYQS